jgi:polyhydroxyalkanoate synthesis regulator phasin
MRANSMNDRLKTYMYSGVGAAAHSKEIVRKLMKELIRERALNEVEGKRIVASAIKNMETHIPNIESQYHKAIHKVIMMANAEIQTLQKKVEKLERSSAPSKHSLAKRPESKKRVAVRKTGRKVAH